MPLIDILPQFNSNPYATIPYLESYADLRHLNDSRPVCRDIIWRLEWHGLASGFASITGTQLICRA